MKLQTPYYLIIKEELDILVKSLKEALDKYWNNSIIGYSYKTNALPWIIKYFQKQECFAEVVSEEEYELAKLIGTEDNCIIYNGPIKTKETFLEALNNGCFVNIDSQREIDWLDELDTSRSYNIGIRVNFDIERVCPGQSSGGNAGGRFGFCYENGELKKAIDKIRQKGFEVKGLHIHTSSKTRAIAIYRALAKKACEIAGYYKMDLEFVDIGGGFFGGLCDKPQFEDYIKVIKEELQKHFNSKRTMLIIEPGMSVVGSPVKYITSVIDVKDTSYGRFVVTDGSRTSIDPLMRKTNYLYGLQYQCEERKIISKQVIVGYTCMEDDRLFIAEDEKELSVGDKIMYDKVGAYTMCLTPLFIKYFPDVYVEEGEVLKQVRKKWAPMNYIQANIME